MLFPAPVRHMYHDDMRTILIEELLTEIRRGDGSHHKCNHKVKLTKKIQNLIAERNICYKLMVCSEFNELTS